MANEIGGLCWEHIDFNLKLMYIKDGLVLVDEYDEDFERIGRKVFLTNQGNGIVAQFLWTKLERLLKKVGFRHIRVHDLRHTFATRCLQAGMSSRVLQVILGHASIEMTEKYTHLVDDLDIAEMEKLQNLYDSKLKTFYDEKEVCEMCGIAA